MSSYGKGTALIRPFCDATGTVPQGLVPDITKEGCMKADGVT